MKLVEILRSTDILRTNIDLGIEIKDIKYNSKKVEKGDVFVAVRGDTTNGHLYIDEAVTNGAVCIVCETVPKDITVPYVVVRNSRIALARMSKIFFGSPDEKLRIIGITGTNGKTSTTYFLREILKARYGDCIGLIGTNQNLVGSKPYVSENTTPQSYDTFRLMREMVDSGCRYCIMEVSSHALVQERVFGIRFELGIFTNLTRDHLDFHVSFENYKKAKRKLFDASNLSIVNVDDGSFNDIVRDREYRTFTYSSKLPNADIFADNVEHKGYKTDFEVHYKGQIRHISIPVPGLFTVYNGMAAISAALLLGVGLSDISLALRTARAVTGRCEYVEAGKPFDVMIDFAHTPDGMKSVLMMARQITKGRIITVFGCGGDRDKTKRPVMGKVAAKYSDKVIITSDNVRTEKPLTIALDTIKGIKNADVDMVLDRENAIKYAMSIAGKGDLIMLLGKGHELYIEANGQRTYFNEREIVKNYK